MMTPMTAPTTQDAALDLLRRSIAASGLSTTAYARNVVLRRPREVRRWLDGSKPIPKSVARWLALHSPQGEPRAYR